MRKKFPEGGRDGQHRGKRGYAGDGLGRMKRWGPKGWGGEPSPGVDGPPVVSEEPRGTGSPFGGLASGGESPWSLPKGGDRQEKATRLTKQPVLHFWGGGSDTLTQK